MGSLCSPREHSEGFPPYCSSLKADPGLDLCATMEIPSSVSTRALRWCPLSHTYITRMPSLSTAVREPVSVVLKAGHSSFQPVMHSFLLISAAGSACRCDQTGHTPLRVWPPKRANAAGRAGASTAGNCSPSTARRLLGWRAQV